MTDDEAAFRRKLVEEVAFGTPWARRYAVKGPLEGLAERIGVSEKVLEEAAALVRSGFLPRTDKQSGGVLLHVLLPQPIAEAFLPIAVRLNMGHGQLVRSMLHATMQTAREPSVRAPRRWRRNGQPVQSHGVGFRGSKIAWRTGKRHHIEVQVSRGLVEALERRAAAYGATRARYVILWLADMCEGMLTDLVVTPVAADQTYDDSRAYVLPAIGNWASSGG